MGANDSETLERIVFEESKQDIKYGIHYLVSTVNVCQLYSPNRIILEYLNYCLIIEFSLLKVIDRPIHYDLVIKFDPAIVLIEA